MLIKRLAASLTLGLALLWGQTALAAPALGAQVGTIATASVASPQYLSTTVDDPAGNLTAVGWSASASGMAFTITDSAGNTYSTPNSQTFNTTMRLLNAVSNTTNDLPGPVTATGSITTTVVTFTTNPGTLAVGQAITGAGVTANTIIASGISQWNGTNASATVSVSQSVVSETLTVSSTIKFTYTGSLVINGAAAYFTGMATSSPADATGTITTGTSTTNTTISPAATVTTIQASTLVIGEVGIVGTFTAYSSQSPFVDTSFAGPAAGNSPNFQWGYAIESSAGPVPYGPKWTTGRVYGAVDYSLKAAGSAAASCQRMALLGVGC